MHTDTLREIVDDIERHCKNTGIPIFYGSAPRIKNRRKGEWERKRPGDWKAFLDAFAPFGSKIVHLECFENEGLDEDEQAETLEYGQQLTGEGRAT